MSLADFKVGTRLGTGFGLLLAIIVLLVVMGLSGLAQVKGNLDDIVKHNMAEISHVYSMRKAIATSAISARDMVLLPDQNAIAREAGQIDKAQQDYDEHLSALIPLVRDAEGKALLAKIRDEYSVFKPLLGKSLQLIKDNKGTEAARVLVEEVLPSQHLLVDSLSEMSALQEKQSAESLAVADSDYSNTRTLAVAMTLIVLALGTLVAWTNTRSITRPLLQALELASAVAKGDLTRRIEVKSRDEVGQLLQALKDMNASLGGIVGKVRSTTDSISTAAQEIAMGNADLSQRTEEQASSLEETASSMEELTSTVRQNAENARQANQLSMSASDIAVKGGQVVGEVVDTMASISASSKKIVDIISVIEGIAFQTNILALNAAVEAARAGEQGRGFAVVAAEVRSLAQRSAAAAKEIKTLIDDSADKVDAGSRQVDLAGATMSEIVSAVKRVTDIMAEISAASNEQSAGIEQVNQAITQMDGVTQQNAALVEEAAAAAEAMQDQSDALKQAVSVFKLETVVTPTGVSRPEVIAIEGRARIASAKPVLLAAKERTRTGIDTPKHVVLALPRRARTKIANPVASGFGRHHADKERA